MTAHHGSLSKEKRLDAEARLKSGRLKALVATASLELGIDIGHVDLVCQIGSPHRIATLLQRVGRSGHTIAGTPKGRVLPVSRDDLVECAALLRSVREGQLDAIVSHDAPLDVLAQQIVAETACRDYAEDDLFALVTRAWPYRALERAAFDRVLQMTADGFATRRGRRAALVHRDEVNATVRGRRGARLLAQTSGGAIPEVADYRVVLDPDDTFIGTLNEDFAIESNAGDIFQLGNASWLILQVAGGNVRVADAKGAPPTIPFWLGEAPARSDELSRAVSDLRAEVDRRLNDPVSGGGIIDWMMAETGLERDAADQAVSYLAEGRRALGVIPSQDSLVLERFFDQAGGMQLVLHAPFGSRINKAWGLALRKRFCRQFNFELQAAATEDALMLSLGPQHSFPLSDVFRYLHPETTRDVLVQAFLDAPVFKTRWRWNTTISLAVPRARGGRKVAPQIQRMVADDLMAAVFPDAAACLENIPGDRQIPDHPLVSQTVRDCLEEAMDFEGLRAVLTRIHRGELRLVARDTPEPSLFAHEILNAKPYAFLDDAPLEERRSHAVQSRRATDPASAGDLGALDVDAIARVREEERPDPRDADELHDAMLTAGFLTCDELDGATARAARAAGCGAASGHRHPAHVRGRAVAGAARDPSRPRRPAPPRSGAKRHCRREAQPRDASAARVTTGEILDPRRSDCRAAERPAHADRPGDRRGVGGSARRLAGGGGRGTAAARGRRGRAARTLHAGCDRAGMVRPDAPRPHPPLHAEPASRRNRAGEPGRLHALPVPLAARGDVVPADGPRRAARSGRRAGRLRACGGGVGAGGAAGPARSLRAVDARHDLPVGRGRMGTSLDHLRPRKPGTHTVGPGDADRAVLARARRGVAEAADSRERSRRSEKKRNAPCPCSAHEARPFSAIWRPPAGSMPISSSMRLGPWSPAGWRRRMDSPDYERWCRPRAGALRRTTAAAGLPGAGPRSRRAVTVPGATTQSSCRRGRCCAAMGSYSGGCSPARPTPRHGASSRVSTGGSRRGARSAAAGS